MANNTWKNYTQKSTALLDNDEVMLLDSTDDKNKRGLMSKFWDYVVDKMATAVISKLETDNKTIIGAINALNGNKIKFVNLQKGHALKFTFRTACTIISGRGASNTFGICLLDGVSGIVFGIENKGISIECIERKVTLQSQTTTNQFAVLIYD